MTEKIEVGSRVTTRYYGGYEAVVVLQNHETYYVVARMGGHAKSLDGEQATSVLPKDQVEKITQRGPALTAAIRSRSAP